MTRVYSEASIEVMLNFMDRMIQAGREDVAKHRNAMIEYYDIEDHTEDLWKCGFRVLNVEHTRKALSETGSVEKSIGRRIETLKDGLLHRRNYFNCTNIMKNITNVWTVEVSQRLLEDFETILYHGQRKMEAEANAGMVT